MKITSFDPVIVTPDAEAAIKVFTDLGFQRTHSPVTSLVQGDVHSFRMENENGFHVDVVSPADERPRDEMLIRMNVDDYDEAYAILTAHGFKNVHADNRTVDTKSSKSVTMVSPSGFRIAIVNHKK